MTAPKQDDLSRQRRLNDGCCPTHGIPLVPGEQFADKCFVFECPRADCDFQHEPKQGTKAFASLFPTKKKRRG